ncbi:MAG: signal recognition particle-docking protein FtsY [Deltaproteobacteria bacterium]|nr:signal recognition particle-docking protein FtsY [Deltaproteobacteria bacterium]MBW2014136.1 signal recognition particle-docking protein FtsY [Deltaproteobacteria bacterium]MBW2088958.1 signal recognition particle-docking protein FtsY [Deltaproteobacteria bacterium]MBW2320417.1 signal recognition particle-docking protein FtsY [Deltaproteobacteria bacterium]
MAFTWFKKNKDAKHKETVPAREASQAETKTQDHTIPPSLMEEGQEKSTGFLNRLKKGLSKTRTVLTTDINELLAGNRKIDDELMEELEELLITSDIGVRTAMDLIQSISKRSSEISGADQLKTALKEKILAVLNSEKPSPKKITTSPHVIMVIGVNGVGKTTTIGKLAAKFAASGKRVIIAAADTFRAAAIEQLGIWAQRAGADFVKHQEMSDPAAVAYDGIEAAMARGADVVLIDTAGRIHTRKNLMEELKKIKRTLSKKLPEAPHEILLVLDATTGQNAISQAELFNDALDVTGIVLTKLDGTAKGGIVVSICRMLEIPLKYISIGEALEDLQEFDAVRFVNALF